MNLKEFGFPPHIIAIDESRVKIDKYDAAIFANGSDLIILQVTGMGTKIIHGTMRSDYRFSSDCNNVVKCLFPHVRNVYHHSKIIHALYNCPSKNSKALCSKRQFATTLIRR